MSPRFIYSCLISDERARNARARDAHNQVIALGEGKEYVWVRDDGIVETKFAPMVVRIRFGRGPVVTRRQGKNSRMALLASSLLTLISICLFSLGVWRLCQDLDLARDFIFADGFLSHWQVWLGAAATTQYICWRLSRYAKTAHRNTETPIEVEKEQEPSGIAANV
jgi:hypothetical protein